MDPPSRSTGTRASRPDNALTETTTPFRQLQYGASLSGAILRDRLFFFAAGERLAVADANVVTISDADIAMIRSNGFDVHNGVITFDRNGTATLGKLDFLPSPSHALSLRGTNARALDENQQPWGGLVARSNGGVGNIEDAAVALTCTSVLTGNLSNELRALYAHHSNRLESLDPSRSPQVTILGVAAFGTQPLLPQPRDTKGLEVFDAISWSGSRGAYKAGFDYTHTAFAVSVPATFAGAYQFSALQEGLPGVPAGGLTAREAFAAGLPYSFAQGFGDPYWKGTTTVLGVFAQGEWNLGDRLLLRLGLRYDYKKPADPLPAPEQLGAEVVFLLGGRRRVACAGRPGPILRRRRDRPDVRDRGQQRHPDDLRQPGPGRGLRRDVPGGAVEPAGPPLPGSGERRGGPLPRARRADQMFRETRCPRTSTSGAALNSESTYADQANLGFELEIGRRLIANVDFLYARGRNILESRNINPLIDGGPRPNPAFASISLDSAAGNSWYKGVTLGVQVPSGGPIEMSAFYTYADTQDDYIDWLTQIPAPGSAEPAGRARTVHQRSEAQGHSHGDLQDNRAESALVRARLDGRDDRHLRIRAPVQRARRLRPQPKRRSVFRPPGGRGTQQRRPSRSVQRGPADRAHDPRGSDRSRGDARRLQSLQPHKRAPGQRGPLPQRPARAESPVRGRDDRRRSASNPVRPESIVLARHRDYLAPITVGLFVTSSMTKRSAVKAAPAVELETTSRAPVTAPETPMSRTTRPICVMPFGGTE